VGAVLAAATAMAAHPDGQCPPATRPGRVHRTSRPTCRAARWTSSVPPPASGGGLMVVDMVVNRPQEAVRGRPDSRRNGS
jgi:hypothetical protein